MSPAFTTRRRAEEFDRLVESTLSGAPVTEPVSADLAELAGFAAALSAVPEIQPRPAFSAALRERLMTAAVTELAAGGGDAITDRLTVRNNPVRRKHERRITVGLASLAIVGASTGTALASQGSLPGQPLYPVKRAIENVRTGFTPSDSGKASAFLSDADTRLDEVAQLSRGSDDDVARINDTLNSFADQAKKASDILLSDYQEHQDAASIEKLHAFTSDSIDQLTVLEPLLPAGAKDALTAAAQAVLMIDTAASNLCPTCAGNPITSIPETLLAATSDTIGTIAKSLQPPAGTGSSTGSGTTGGGKTSPTLPHVPSNVGPANVLPSLLPTIGKSGSGTSTGQGSTRPTSKPSTIGGVVQGVTGGVGDTLDGVTGGLTNGLTDQLDNTVGGVTGGVDDLLGGLLGSTKTTAP
ncbi:DUF5667 domain-containing protein [Nocardioides nematodiphilus]|uniref:DUF5667 domain-containing protein n=1 Tax=Nocardioides nematodiphilus TaxID=2849669 RepID=UPI001CD9DC81|nr:DUF5667 domain-containing protein [Nocardioides nematodiphilus]MCA1981578.1 DUF5667 domain-containing protein [Nocardioides nematodiphilus]